MGRGGVPLKSRRVPLFVSGLPLNEEEVRDSAVTGLAETLAFSLLWHGQGKLGGLVSARSTTSAGGTQGLVTGACEAGNTSFPVLHWHGEHPPNPLWDVSQEQRGTKQSNNP